jgi:glycine cleavage system aminomethyltransferase T
VIGLGVLDTQFTEPGMRLEVAGAGAATVESLPIYDTDKRRPRD